MSGYERLADAIVLQAVKDYRRALKQIKINPVNKTAIADSMECERFFRSKWYSVLTDIDSEYLIDRISKEVKI